jgi:hypothetical protein
MLNMRRFFPQSFYNPITLAGAAVSAISFGLILFLMVLETFGDKPKPYMGIIAFVLLPAILIVGVAGMVVGILREHRREKTGKPHGMHLPRVDFNNPHHRAAFTAFAVGAVLLLLFSAFGSYKAYEYTDSDAFCGETCHSVMSPEYTAYQDSPHARVGCAQCHIGSGADWYVKSKITGAYQVYATLFNKYPKPIPTPIENLRPAQETCEQCHWPKHFFSEKLHQNTYFLSDSANTRWNLDILVKIGGGNSESGPTSGIHWHMNIANEITYAASDTQRQVIPWVRSRHPGGGEVIYRSTENPITEDSVQKLNLRRMDCIDCHNRPTHIYHPPARSVNHVMALGWISPALPGAKGIAVKALETPYPSTQVALDSIAATIKEYYRSTYPQVAAAHRDDIQRMVEEVRKIYARNYFPEMGVTWKDHNNNIGHLYYPGCFRCHDGKHVSEDGKVLSRDCNVCHVILAQQFQSDTARVSLKGVEYVHPVDIGDAWKETNCSDCHNPH